MKPTTIRRLLRLYPARWRDRYGEEFTALLEAHSGSIATVADVLLGALRARILAVVAPDARSLQWDALRQELRYALRGVRRQPGFAAAVAVTLGLGIGANAAMFGIVDRLLFREPATLRDGARVHRAYLARTVNGKEFQAQSTQYRRYLDLTAWTTSFDRTAAFSSGSAAVGVGEDAREMRIAAVSASLFDFFDAKPVIGRFFTEKEDATPAGTPVAVITYPFWQAHYGGTASVLGEQLHIGPIVYTVIGVAPQGFTGVTASSPVAFIPITSFGADMLGDRNSTSYYTTYNTTWMEMIVRRKPGVSVETATADMTAAFRKSYEAQRALRPRTAPIEVARPHAIVGPLLSERGPNQSNASKVATWLVGVTAMVLLIACANVANLLLARALGRRREIAVRIALGVSRARLIAQLLAESALLAVLGGVVGLAMAQWGGKVLGGYLLPEGAAASTAGDARTLLFTGGAVLLVSCLIGVVPVLQVGKGDLASGLRAGTREAAYSRSRARLALQVVQVAVSLVLLVGSGLFVRSLLNVESLHLGYDVDPILYVEPQLRNEALALPELAALKRRLLERAQALTGVAAAARVTTVPFYSTSSGSVFVPGVDTSVINRFGEFTRQAASPEYFTTAGTRILRGHAFTSADMQGTPRVAVVTDAMAKALWPGEDALGKCFRTGSDTDDCMTVIGVSENIRLEMAGGDGELHYFMPIEQRSPAAGGLFIRMRGDGRNHVEAIRRELQRLMPGTAYVTVTPFSDIVGSEMRSWRLGAVMFTVFGLLALVLAAVGLYGVIAHNVTQRTHELGVRVALGAQGRDVIRLVVGEGVRLGVAGILAGTAVSLWGGKRVAPLLFNESPRDPVVFVVVIAMLVVVAAVASWIPARRATKVDPNVALRAE